MGTRARPIRVGSRGSELALVQARWVIAGLEAAGEACELMIVETTGDRFTDRPLHQVGGSGLFIKEIEAALLDGRVDVAVHSMKDLPSAMTDSLRIAATTQRHEPRDALVSRGAASIDDLPRGAVVATGSLRRRSQLKAARADLRVEDLRGNVPTRLEKFDASDWDAVVLAAAGLLRLDVARAWSAIPVDRMVPAVGQGALAIQTRADDGPLVAKLRTLNDPDTEVAVRAERAFLARLEGGCQVPLGAYAVIEGEEVALTAFVGAVDGSPSVRRSHRGTSSRPEDAGRELAERMLEDGAADILARVREAT